jgi:hypothetical protein
MQQSDIRIHPKLTTVSVSNEGHIYSNKTGKMRKTWKTKHGYMLLSLWRLGLTQEEIAGALEYCVPTIIRALKKNGYKSTRN